MTNSATIDGLAELEKAFEEIGTPSLRKSSARRALRKAAEPLADDMRSRAPVRSGTLRDSIAVSTKLNKSQSREHRKIDEKAGVEVFVGAAYARGRGGRHAHLIEFGTGPRYQKDSGKYVGEIAPQPFARPAWDAQKSTILETIKKETWADLKKTAERASRKATRLAARAR